MQQKRTKKSSSDKDLLNDLSGHERILEDDTNALWRRYRWLLWVGLVLAVILLLWSYLNFLCATVQVSDSKDINWLLRLFYGDRCNRRGSAIGLPSATGDDNQRLSLNGTTISIDGGNSIDLSPIIITPAAQGPQGPAGASGTSGSNGATGPTGPAGAPGPVVLTNVLTFDQTGTSSSVNGVADTVAFANLAPDTLLGFDGGGSPVWDSVSNILTNNTTVSNTSVGNLLDTTVNGVTGAAVTIINSNTLVNDGTNTLTSTVNGVVASDVIINTVSNSSVGNNLTTTVNGVVGLAVPVINSNAFTWDKATGQTSTVNGIAANQTVPVGILVDFVGYDALGNPVNDTVASVLALNTTNTLVNDGINTLTSTVNGVADSDVIINSNVLNLAGNNLTSTVNGVVSNILDLSTINPNCVLAGPFFCQNGNSFGAAGVLGTLDNNDQAFITNGLTRMVLEADGDLSFNAGTLFGDATNSRVGVNTSAPTEALDVIGNSIISENIAVGGAYGSLVNPNAFINVNVAIAPSAPTTGINIAIDSSTNELIVGSSKNISNSAAGGLNDGMIGDINFVTNNDLDSSLLYGTFNQVVSGTGSVGIMVGSRQNVGTNSNGNIQTLAGNLAIAQTGGAGTIDNAFAYTGQLNNLNTATIDVATVYDATLDNFGTMNNAALFRGFFQNNGGTIANSIDGLNISGWLSAGGSSANVSRGIYIDDSISIAATNWAFASDSTADSYFTGNVGAGINNPTTQLTVAGSGAGGNAGIQWEGVASAPALSSANAGRIYFNATSQQFECSINTGAYTPCINAGTLVSADNGLTVNPVGNVQLGGNLIQNTTVTNNGFDMTFAGSSQNTMINDDGTLLVNTAVPVPGKVAVFNGDVNITGVIDPTALLFSDTTGVSSYDPATNNGYRIGVTGVQQRSIYVSPMLDNQRVFEVRDAGNINTILSVDSVNRSVGITNVTTPLAQLHLGAGTTGGAGTAGIQWDGVGSNPALSSPGSGRIYFDNSLNLFQCSENAGAYFDCFGGVTTVTAGAGLTNSGTATNPILDVLADNGLQVDAAADRVRLGGAPGSAEATNAALLFDTEVQLAGNDINWAGSGFYGIGVPAGTAPQEKLHVMNGGPEASNVLFEGQLSGAAVPNVFSSTTRMFWAPGRGSFRAGTATAGQWNNGQVGDNSAGFGLDNIAAGNESMAWGEQNVVFAGANQGTAWGIGNQVNPSNNSTAFGLGNQVGAGANQATTFGEQNQANATNSTALGISTVASADQALAFGNDTNATGINSTSFGANTNATQQNATAFGNTTQATNSQATAFGTATTASGLNSTAFGQSSIVNITAANGTAFGNNTVVNGVQGTAFGDNTISNGQSSTAWGGTNGGAGNTVAQGDYSTAFGITTLASGLASTTFGQSTQASATAATAYGTATTASAVNSTTFGQGTVVNNTGTNGTAHGLNTVVNGVQGTAFGDNTQANGASSTAWGGNNGGAGNTIAQGDYSTAFGVTTLASGLASTSFGQGTQATATDATAFGTGTTASALNSTAFGQSSVVSAAATNGTAFGNTTQADGAQATAFGLNTDAIGLNSTAFGDSAQATNDQATAFGNTTVASGIDSTAFGTGSQAQALNATAFGQTTTASNANATSFGNTTIASGAQSTAFGLSTIASATNSTAFGNTSLASGIEATAFGSNTQATNDQATAFGNTTVASGTFSTAFGTGSQAQAINSTSFGQTSVVSAAATNGTAFGNNTQADGAQSTAFGFSTDATGTNATSFGNTTLASGLESTSWGLQTAASGDQSTTFGTASQAAATNGTAWGNLSLVNNTATNGTAFGNSTVVNGIQGTAFGDNTIANGLSATAWGGNNGAPGNTIAQGNYATAFGITTQASGLASTSFGQASQAVGDMSTAFGTSSTANAINSTSWGSLTQVLVAATNGTAFGDQTISGGVNSTSFGLNSQASGDQSSAFGQSSIASATNSTAFGNTTQATGLQSTAFGQNTQATADNSTAFGISTLASSSGATAFGFATQATNNYATAFGEGSVAVGLRATAWGDSTGAAGVSSTAWGSDGDGLFGPGNTQALGDYSTAFGVITTASGMGSTSYGLRTDARGDFSTAWGFQNLTSGQGATSWGSSNYATGAGSTVWGEGNITGTTSVVPGILNADTYLQTIFGSYAVRNGDNVSNTLAEALAENDQALIIGNGASDISRSSAFYVTYNGNVDAGFGSAAEATFGFVGDTNTGMYRSAADELSFTTGGTQRAVIDSVGNMAIGAGAATNRLDVVDTADDTVASFTGLTQTCTVDTSGAGGWSCSSDSRLKENILDLEGGLESVLALNAVTYNYKSNSSETVAGFIAQEVEKILPGLVGTDAKGFKTLNKDGMIPYLVEALKAQNGQLEETNKALVSQGIVLDEISAEVADLVAQAKKLEERADKKDAEDIIRDKEIEELKERLKKLESTTTNIAE